MKYFRFRGLSVIGDATTEFSASNVLVVHSQLHGLGTGANCQSRHGIE